MLLPQGLGTGLSQFRNIPSTPHIYMAHFHTSFRALLKQSPSQWLPPNYHLHFKHSPFPISSFPAYFSPEHSTTIWYIFSLSVYCLPNYIVSFTRAGILCLFSFHTHSCIPSTKTVLILKSFSINTYWMNQWWGIPNKNLLIAIEH